MPRTDKDVAWAAALFEGEGSFGFSRVRGKLYPQAMLKTTDYDVICRFHRIVGVGAIYPVKPRKTASGRDAKPAWNWKTSGENAGVVAALLFDQLGTRRRQAAQAILDNLAARIKTCAHCGQEFVAKRSFARVCSRRCRDKLNHDQGRVRYNQLRAQGTSPDVARRLRYTREAPAPRQIEMRFPAMSYPQLHRKYPDKHRVLWHRISETELRADLLVARRFRELRTNTPESAVGAVIEGWIAQELRARTPGLN